MNTPIIKTQVDAQTAADRIARQAARAKQERESEAQKLEAARDSKIQRIREDIDFWGTPKQRAQRRRERARQINSDIAAEAETQRLAHNKRQAAETRKNDRAAQEEAQIQLFPSTPKTNGLEGKSRPFKSN